MSDECFYFGCVHGMGHYPHNPELLRVWQGWIADFLNHHDGKLCPQDPKQIEGKAILHHFHTGNGPGYTVLAFWDRSKDDRKNSNSMVFKVGIHPFDEMLAAFKKSFAVVYLRFKFPIDLVGFLEHGNKDSEPAARE